MGGDISPLELFLPSISFMYLKTMSAETKSNSKLKEFLNLSLIVLVLGLGKNIAHNRIAYFFVLGVVHDKLGVVYDKESGLFNEIRKIVSFWLLLKIRLRGGVHILIITQSIFRLFSSQRTHPLVAP